MHVHTADCADLTRGARREPAYADGWTIDVASAEEVVKAIYPPGDFDYPDDDWQEYAGGIHFFPCCKGLA